MLTRRTNVLFEEVDYLALTQLAKETNKTIGEIMRESVRKTLKIQKRKSLTNTQKALEDIKKITKGMNFPGIDYKALVNEGRKY